MIGTRTFYVLSRTERLAGSLQDCDRTPSDCPSSLIRWRPICRLWLVEITLYWRKYLVLAVHVHRDCIHEASGRSDPRLTDLRCGTVSFRRYASVHDCRHVLATG